VDVEDESPAFEDNLLGAQAARFASSATFAIAIEANLL
jgi:hypothetical protein